MEWFESKIFQMLENFSLSLKLLNINMLMKFVIHIDQDRLQADILPEYFGFDISFVEAVNYFYCK